jgi:hypothetical protein
VIQIGLLYLIETTYLDILIIPNPLKIHVKLQLELTKANSKMKCNTAILVQKRIPHKVFDSQVIFLVYDLLIQRILEILLPS